MQQVVDAACGHEHAFVRGDVELDALLALVKELA
jgi:hypothetical protein